MRRPRSADTGCVQWLVTNAAWPALLVLAYVLSTCVLNVLSGHLRHERKLHDLLRETHATRRDYLNSLIERQGGR